ncbi:MULTISPECIES: hypothetical protein [Burkholderia cepacia complex]|uniref:hypothetical protein n=1 Tax=Burkholderia cenocepacia TaxID=95486 RepID=UPI002876A261|nr:hypothetical protein [Burkholderia cenocepacia]MDS0848472.1 hypothetical protein [Burkholderia cenocepacia]
MSTLDEKRALATSRFLLPSHDAPALISGGKVVGVMQNAISNPPADVTKAASYTSLTAGRCRCPTRYVERSGC